VFKIENIKRILKPYLVNLLLLGIALIIYKNLSYYKSFLYIETQTVLTLIFFIYAIFGLPYYFLKRKYSDGDSTEKAILVLHIFTKILPSRFSSSKGERKGHIFDRETKVALLSYAVKFFFLPIMINFFFTNFSSLVRYSTQFTFTPPSSTILFDQIFNIIYNFIFVLDTIIASFAYAVEVPFLKNRIKSVDFTFFGWGVCLATYPPFNSTVASIIPLTTGPYAIITSEVVLKIIRVLTLISYGVYVWATVALGVKFSNLSNRGIVSKGPYRFIRHPAYAAKNFAWWLEYLPSLSNISTAVFLLAWNFIYYLRAVTEERHLMQDIDYQQYAKKVRYRFIPFVF